MSASTHFANLRSEAGFLKSEIGFIDMILVPLFEAAHKFSNEEISEIMNCLADTRNYYAEQQHRLTAQALHKTLSIDLAIEKTDK